jgi:hypothetical protein
VPRVSEGRIQNPEFTRPNAEKKEGIAAKEHKELKKRERPIPRAYGQFPH